MWVPIKTVDKDDVDKTPTDGCIDLCEAIRTDLWSARSCLERVSFELEGLVLGKRRKR